MADRILTPCNVECGSGNMTVYCSAVGLGTVSLPVVAGIACLGPCGLWWRAGFLRACRVSGPALLLSHGTAGSKDINKPVCGDACSCSRHGSVGLLWWRQVRSFGGVFQQIGVAGLRALRSVLVWRLVSSCGGVRAAASLRRCARACIGSFGCLFGGGWCADCAPSSTGACTRRLRRACRGCVKEGKGAYSSS